jgi:hypothetical protein
MKSETKIEDANYRRQLAKIIFVYSVLVILTVLIIISLFTDWPKALHQGRKRAPRALVSFQTSKFEKTLNFCSQLNEPFSRRL